MKRICTCLFSLFIDRFDCVLATSRPAFVGRIQTNCLRTVARLARDAGGAKRPAPPAARVGSFSNQTVLAVRASCGRVRATLMRERRRKLTPVFRVFFSSLLFTTNSTVCMVCAPTSEREFSSGSSDINHIGSVVLTLVILNIWHLCRIHSSVSLTTNIWINQTSIPSLAYFNW